MKIVAVVLTFNEEIHVARCIDSLHALTPHILVVDSLSTDATRDIATSLGARVLEHRFVNQASQFNWALEQVAPDTQWVFRVDADEYLEVGLAREIAASLPQLAPQVVGVFVNRRIMFLGKLIAHGGVARIPMLRLFRFGHGRSEDRWMDEHIVVDGPTVRLRGDLIDDNRKGLTFWTDKHNRYASREAVERLNLKHHFFRSDTTGDLAPSYTTGLKRWIKEKVYARLPGGVGASLYFFYRAVLTLGFLDGWRGLTFHVLQGFWYRWLVDAKVHEVELYMKQQRVGVVEAVRIVLGIDVEMRPS